MPHHPHHPHHDHPDAHVTDDELLDTAIPIDVEAMEASPEEVEQAKGFGSSEADLVPIDIASADEHIPGAEIKTFGPARLPHEEVWTREPNVTGKGAIHVRTFVAKLRLDAIDHLDAQVNQWLDNHPEYEVKFVTTTVGTLVGKISEEAIFMNVWV